MTPACIPRRAGLRPVWPVMLLVAFVTTAGGAGSPPYFEEVASRVGLSFVHENGAAGQYYMPELLGAGVALFDYDGDGDLDVYLVQGGPLDGRRGAERPTHRLFRNDLDPAKGPASLRFTDVTAPSGTGHTSYGMGVAVGDYDNDGHEDLYVTAFGSNVLYRNNGDGTFTDVTAEAGVDDDRWSTAAAFVDYDRDGDLDLFVANYLDFTTAANRQCFDPAGARDYCSPTAYAPAPDRLFRNDGNGRFTDVSGAAGILKAFGAGLGVAIGDYDGDGWPDIYVANDATPNQLWINRRDGTFSDEGPLSGAALSAAGTAEGSMGVASGDYDGDGDEDLFITHIIGETFVLYRNDGRGNFDDVRGPAGLAQPTAPFTGFGTDWFDYDADGWLDLFVANGAVNRLERLRGNPNPFHMTNQLFRNLGSGRFREVTGAAGPAFELSEVSRAAAFGDLDNDGTVDIVVTNNGGPARLLLNRAGTAHNWLQLRLEPRDRRRTIVGSRVGIAVPGLPVQWRRLRTDGSYLAANDPRIHVGLGSHGGRVEVTVEWLGGGRERWIVDRPNQFVTLRQGDGL